MYTFDVTYKVVFKITDKDLFDKLDHSAYSDDDEFIVEFLTIIQDNIRYSESYLKRWVSVESDELYWDYETGVGEIEVLINIIDNYDLDEVLWKILLTSISEELGIELNTDITSYTPKDIAAFIAEGSPLYSAVYYGTEVTEEQPDQLFLYGNENLADKYIGKVFRADDPKILRLEFNHNNSFIVFPEGVDQEYIAHLIQKEI